MIDGIFNVIGSEFNFDVRSFLLLYDAILLFVGTGDLAISFGRLEVFLRGTLTAHKLGGEMTVMLNVDRDTRYWSRE